MKCQNHLCNARGFMICHFELKIYIGNQNLNLGLGQYGGAKSLIFHTKLMVCDSVDRKMLGREQSLRIGSIWRSNFFTAGELLICDSVGRMILIAQQILSFGLGQYEEPKSFM